MRRWLALPLLALAAGPVRALEPPPDLPRYDLAVTLDAAAHTVQVRERVTWTNRHLRPAGELVFNVYPHFQIAKAKVPLLPKTVELLREDPSVAMDPAGHSGDVTAVTCRGRPVAT